MKKKAGVKESASDKKLIILNDFFRNDDVLFFYEKKRDLVNLFRTIVSPLSLNEQSTLYIYRTETDKIDESDYYKKNENFFHFPILDRKYKKLFVDDIKNFQKKLLDFIRDFQLNGGSKLKVLIDFDDSASAENIDQIIHLKNKLSKNHSINQIYTFNIHSLTKELIEKLSKTGESFVITSPSAYMVFSSFHPSGKTEQPHIEPIPYEDIEDRVKKSLYVIIYSILQNSSLCGFDVIKNIVQNFNILLSQGTVYPILYDLCKNGYLEVEMQSDNKTRVYSVSKDGKKYFKNKISNYLDAQERIMAFVRSQLEVNQDE